MLDAGSIVAVSRYYDIDPPSGGIYVSTAEAAMIEYHERSGAWC